MQLVEVTDAATAKAFILANVEINKMDPHYIRPLDKDIRQIFDPCRNKTFAHGEVIRWILEDAQGRLIGRIAAFVNTRYTNKGDDMPVGGIGFFDCINDQRAADILFDVSKHWLMQRGMHAMDGPVNFGERDRWWGLLVHGFEEPLYCMNFNPPYYRALFEDYGFRTFYNQLCFSLEIHKPFHKKILNRHAAVAADPAFQFVHADKRRLEKFARDFAIVYNKAWAGHEGMKAMPEEQAIRMFRQMKPVMDEQIVWFVYHHKDPVAIFINLPDLNQWFKYLDGRFSLWDKLRFMRIKKTRTNTKMVGLVFGIVPEYQGKGVDGYMIVEASKVLQQLAYTQYEMQWIGDFNPKMINLARRFGETLNSRTLTTYRYLFDPLKEFNGHPLVG
ncbi:MAG: hypothetical protein P0Y53_01915 [Candidatus Pseudobacter hemicellulosilyticus]|uniref:N-acetyltransferase domain-containing protein n=1 Tax=Candidatus Pseudobacter hemicellulosilyticus TaxID=3121375 RepID=A0AAJ6BGI8_9BACT|nr:MAG: hypothetical protein P0Y53_01915 [Pseudobacter sp.]